MEKKSARSHELGRRAQGEGGSERMWEPYRGWGAGLGGPACHAALRVTAAARPPNSKHTRPAATATIGPLRAGAPLEGHQQHGSTQSPKSQVRRRGSRPYLLAETRERDSERTQKTPASALHGPARHSGEDPLWRREHSGGPLRTFSPSGLTLRGRGAAIRSFGDRSVLRGSDG